MTKDDNSIVMTFMVVIVIDTTYRSTPEYYITIQQKYSEVSTWTNMLALCASLGIDLIEVTLSGGSFADFTCIAVCSCSNGALFRLTSLHIPYPSYLTSCRKPFRANDMYICTGNSDRRAMADQGVGSKRQLGKTCWWKPISRASIEAGCNEIET